VTCWDTEGQIVECEGTGQDGELQRGAAPPDPRFIARGDGTVTDELTGLTWVQDPNVFGEVTWEEALASSRTLAAGGYDLSDDSKKGDWRLPNIRELLSLVDYGQGDPILPSGHQFKNPPQGIYWTSTTLAPAPQLAWMITLGIGPTVFVVKDTPARMWPVRGVSTRVLQSGQRDAWDASGTHKSSAAGTGQDGDLKAGVSLPDSQSRFDDQNNGTVRDRLTGLVWLKNADPFGFQTWHHALACCRALHNGDSIGPLRLADGSRRGDWRLPNVREIESLVDYGQFAPCLPKGHEKTFINVRPSSYWTSTTVAQGATEAMFIILGVGPSIFENKEHPFFVWPVRDSQPHEGNGR